MRQVLIGADGTIVLDVPELLVRLGVGPGDALTVSLVHDSLVLVPAPRDVVEVTYGTARGMWREAGGSAAYIREVEESWRA